MDLKLARLLNVLEEYPYRSKLIKGIRCEVSDGGDIPQRAQAFIRLLRLVAPSIQRLDLISLPCNGIGANDWDDWSSALFYPNLSEANITFDRLIHLRFVKPWLQTKVVDTWMLRIPNLRELELSIPERIPSTVFLPPSTPINPFHHLRRITIHQQRRLTSENGNWDVLATLLPYAANISFLRIRGDWKPDGDDPCLKALGKYKNLKTVICRQLEDTSERGWGGIRFCRFGLVTEEQLCMEEATATYGGFWHETEELEWMVSQSSFCDN